MVVKTGEQQELKGTEDLVKLPDTDLLKKMLLEEEELLVEEITVDCICGVY